MVENKSEEVDSCNSAKGHDDNRSENKDDQHYEWESDIFEDSTDNIQIGDQERRGEEVEQQYGYNFENIRMNLDENDRDQFRIQDIDISDRVVQPNEEEIVANDGESDTEPPLLVNTESNNSENPLL